MRPSFAEVDLGAIAHNVRTFAELVEPAEVLTVVKADAYGHGDVPVARTALDAGASWLAVAMVEEAVRLRAADLAAPILLLSEPPLEDVAEIRRWRITPSVYRASFIDALAADAEPLGVHLLVDTGMHRVGATPDEVPSLARVIERAPSLRLDGVWTHFAVAENDEEYTRIQIQRFAAVLEAIRGDGIDPGTVHLANSAGALYVGPEASMARIGLGTYGVHPDPARPIADLRPAMRIVSEVSSVRRLSAGERPSYGRRRALPSDAWVATVPIGYADGVPRILSLRQGSVLVGGRRKPFAGVITMDQLMVDCGDDRPSVGDEVVLLGAQGDEEITADEWAQLADTISWEILTGIGPRLPRIHRPVQSSG